ncbi:hybrid sensor histidine kinase/response regulator [Nostoc sp.]|uniref:hybrid sensor histidine kinase/response regulator n=1 Tax=Nostoc sp. TaxID=1180 RepID=UPI002FF4AA1F
MKFWNQHLTTNVASSFLVLSLVAVAVVGGVTFFKAREDLKQAAFNRLSVAATLKEEEITRWFEDQQRNFLLPTRFLEVQKNIKILLRKKPSDSDYLTAYKVLSAYLMNMAQTQPSFKEIFILDRSNRIILSTEKMREGQYELLGNVTYVEQVEPGESFVPIFYVSPITGKPSVTLATPLYNQTGVHQGIILAHLDLDRIDHIVRQRTGLGKSGETYLVGSLVTKNTFISKEQTNIQKFPVGISSKGIDEAMSGVSGYGLYRNYAGVPVIGVYRWLNDRDIALLVEMHQEEAFVPARQLAATIMLVGLVSVAGLLVGIYWLTRQLQISRKQSENYSHKLEQKAQEAEAANRAKSKFLANMSHELRTPLNAILGFTQLISRDRSVNPLHLENLEIISRSGEHLLTLINDVLSMAKIEAGRTILNESSFDLYRLLDSLEEILQPKAESKALWLLFEHSPEIPQYVETDETKLRQILINLLGNAIKFTQTGGVTLRVKMGEGNFKVAEVEERENFPLPHTRYSLHFEVEDTGHGIAPAELEGLFQPFIQTEVGRNSQQGTGLGLTISQQFIRLMGGDITVRSTLNQGTIFTFNIQISPAKEVQDQTRQPYRRVIGLEPDQPKYRILVVEDKWENRQLLVKMLASLGFEVREAEDGQQGVALWETWEPHLIWMDMRMPMMDGYEATRQIKSHLKGQATVIIALTASAFDEEKSVVLSSGCDDFVRKPFQESVIWEKMAEYLGVRYVFEESNYLLAVGNQPSNQANSYLLTAQSLTVMPPDWVAQLHQAAVRTDEKLIFKLLEQIPELNSPLAMALADLVNNFRIDKVIEITQPQQK